MSRTTMSWLVPVYLGDLVVLASHVSLAPQLVYWGIVAVMALLRPQLFPAGRQ